MSIVYRIYTNGGRGGPVDFSAPVASTADLTYDAGELAPSTDTTFAVRAFDPDSGLEEANTEARVRVVIGPGGEDVSVRPGASHALLLSAGPDGSCRVAWAYAPGAGRVAPDGFDVYVWPGASGDRPPAAARVPYTPGRVGYSLALPGPFAPGVYEATVVASGPAGGGDAPPPVSAALGPPAEPFGLGTVTVSYL